MKIKEAAIQRAHIADLAVTTAKIDDGQITHFKLGDGSIHSAKIQNAAIQTLHVAGNAITVPAGFYAQGGAGYSANETIAIVGMDAEGSLCTAFFSAVAFEGGAEDSRGATWLDLRLNGGPIISTPVTAGVNGSVSFAYQFSPGFGAFTLSVTSSGTVPFSRRCLTVIGTKR